MTYCWSCTGEIDLKRPYLLRINKITGFIYSLHIKMCSAIIHPEYTHLNEKPFESNIQFGFKKIFENYVDVYINKSVYVKKTPKYAKKYNDWRVKIDKTNWATSKKPKKPPENNNISTYPLILE